MLANDYINTDDVHAPITFMNTQETQAQNPHQEGKGYRHGSHWKQNAPTANQLGRNTPSIRCYG